MSVPVWFVLGGRRATTPLELPEVPRAGEWVVLPRLQLRPKDVIGPGTFVVRRVEWHAELSPSTVHVDVEHA